MENFDTALMDHGYVVLVTAVFLQAIGLPVPVALGLLLAGAAAAHGSLTIPYALGAALAAMLAGDTLMYWLGRSTGWWLLGVLCRISLNPESCILRSADAFYRRGQRLLLVAKFIPAVNTMAPPLAGSMNMRFATFLRLDMLGAVLYISSYFAVGYVFSGAINSLTRGYHAAGRAAGWLVMVVVLAYLGFLVRWWIKARALGAVPLANPDEAAGELAAGAAIYDVRSHGYFDSKATRIRGSRRLDPNAVLQSETILPSEKLVYLYCTCVRQATSARVARELQTKLESRGVRVVVIRGGLRAWTKAGLPVEDVPADELAALPAFN